MYYCICVNHSFSYEIYEILSIYYPGEKLTLCESLECVPDDCILIRSSLESTNTALHACSSLTKVNKGIYELIHSEEVVYPLEDDLRKSGKQAVKQSVFKLFKAITELDIPWGILVGIRPSKIVNELKSRNVEIRKIEDILKNRYLLREDKIRLTMDISDISYNIINRDKDAVSIYIGIPFCPTRCVYCSFASYPIVKHESSLGSYMDTLKYEIDNLSPLARQKFRLDTIYIGGGTPTSLPDSIFEELLSYITRGFDVNKASEFTVEAGRPDTISQNKLNSMKKHGVSRISINPQSMNDETLQRIGRNHTVQEIIDKFNLARSSGFDNINMDIILGLPGEELSHIKTTLKKILELSPENITVHTMAVKRASALREKLMENVQIPLPEASKVNEMMDYVQETLHINGYLPYYMYRQKNMVGNLENIGYCKEKFECIYNIQMIEEKETIIGIGADAVTKLVFPDQNRIERIANKKDIKEYIRTIEQVVDGKVDALQMLT